MRDGWIIAMSSYRREGVIVGGAVQDTLQLRDLIAKQRGELKCVILEGRSMGGMIVTYAAENEHAPSHYHVRLIRPTNVSDACLERCREHLPVGLHCCSLMRAEAASPTGRTYLSSSSQTHLRLARFNHVRTLCFSAHKKVQC